MPGRETRAEGEALGRSLAVAWFETKMETDEGIVVHRVERSSQALMMQLSTLAEILHVASEAYPALGAAAPARATKIAMEARYANIPRYIHHAEHLWQEIDSWMFLLTQSDPAETKYLAESDPQELTNMALARQLELLKGTNKRGAWQWPKARLLAALAG